ncbi:MAG: hypothetical protein ACKVXR_13850 [Planctomycetota bacterium]
MKTNAISGNARRAGLTLTELAIVSSVMVIVLFAGIAVVLRDTRLSNSTIVIGTAETHAQRMIRKLVTHLSPARGEIPQATLTIDLSAADLASVSVDTTDGFPDQGTLLLDRGTGGMERIAYTALDSAATSFTTLTRGSECTTGVAHAAGATVLWSGTAFVVDLAGTPPASAFDGRTTEPEGLAHFIGDGTGFSYRVPTDPAGGDDVLDDGDIRWGAVVNGTPMLTGWSALVYQPRGTITEAEVNTDLNRDGDRTDTFEVGQIRARSWDSADSTVPASDIGLGPSVILQERCRRGGDLDGDGFADPIFLWDAAQRRLHVRLFVLGRSTGEVPAVRRVESMIFLRNETGP